MLYLSHRIDRLVDFLVKNLIGKSPFQKRTVLLPSRLNQQWLMASLAKRMDGGALMGLEILTWRDALMRLSPRFPGEFELRLAIAELLEKRELPPLADWIGNKPERKGKLARILSRALFEAGFYGLKTDVKWQEELVRILSVEGPWRFPDQMLETARISSELHLFGIDEMPQKAWDFFVRQKASIYLFSPCSLYWEDLSSDREKSALLKKTANAEEIETYLNESHPLLANWGKVGRRTIRRLDALESVEAYDFEPKETFLHRLQQGLLELDAEGITHPPDSSLEIAAAGSSKLREVQILRDRLLAYFKKTQCDPADVLVLAPDIKPYAPLIHFVFGDEMPYRIAPIDGLSSNLFLQGLFLFFDLAVADWEADGVFELFENRAFRGKQQLSAEDLELFRGWAEGARVRGGWGGKQSSWSEGLKRILLGLAQLLPDEEIENLNLGQAEKLDRFLQLIEQLCTLFGPFRSQENRTLNEWGDLLSKLAEALFLPEEKEKELFSSFLRKLSTAAKKFPEALFSWQLIRSLFEDACQSAADSYQANLWQAVQFSSLQPGSIWPAKAIFLLGMESSSFPRKRAAGSFDWSLSSADPGDVDRYLLLQVLFAAQDHLTISYCHISEDDGKPVELALPLQELKIPPIFYPSLPFDKSLFESGLSYSMADYRAAVHAGKPAPFWPKAPSLESKRTIDLKEIALLAKNPWKFFLQKTMGIYLRKEPLFSELRSRDFELPVYTKRRLLFQSLTRPIEDVLKEKGHLLPPGVLNEGLQADLAFESREWKERLDKWGIDPKEIFSIRFSPRCKEARRLKEGWIEAPSLKVGDIEIVGDLKQVAPSGLLIESSRSKCASALGHWPLLLVHLVHLGQKKASLFNLNKGGSSDWEIDAPSALERWIAYQLRAEESLSPLIKPWAELFLKNDFHEWSQKAHEALSKEEDPWVRWVALRASPCPLEKIWEEWSGFSRETFQELV